MRKPRYIFEIYYDEADEHSREEVPANDSEEAVEIFNEDHLDAEITDIKQFENEPEYES